MKIQFLGTGAAEGIPALFCQCSLCRRAEKAGGRQIRTRCGAMINDLILMDLTPDLYLHKLRFGLDLSKVEAVVVTHSHSDHFDGAELTRRSTRHYCHMEREKPLVVYGNEAVCGLGRDSIKVEFGEETNPSISFVRVKPYDTWEAGGVRFRALPASHDPGEECLVYVIEDGESRILYGNDTGLLSGEAFDDLESMVFDMVSLDCTFGALKAPAPGHMGLEENAVFLEELRKRGCLKNDTQVYATHFSHNCGMLHEELEDRAKAYGIHIAWDGLCVHTMVNHPAD